MPAPDTPLRALQKAVKADPEGAYVYETEMTVEAVREAIDEASTLEGSTLMDVFDTAQGPVFSEDVDEAFVIIRIRRG